MKKSFYFALALTAGLFASCSSDDLTADAPQNQGIEVNENDPAQINIGISNLSYTRGTGTVGYPTNKWMGQKFNVFMFNRGSFKAATYKDEDNEQELPIFLNAELTTDVNSNTANYKLNDVVQYNYFPGSGTYSFWAYRADDAASYDGGDERGNATWYYADAEGAEVADSTTATQLIVPVEIDGSQDLMVAVTDTAAALRKLNAYLEDHGQTADLTFDDKRIYSAYAARRTVNPQLKFKHLLSRLYFQVKAATIDVSDKAPLKTDADGEQKGFKITKVTVKTKTKGKILAANLDPEFDCESDRISWDTNQKWDDVSTLAGVELKSRLSSEEKADYSYKTVGSVNVADETNITAPDNYVFLQNGESTIAFGAAVKCYKAADWAIDEETGLPADETKETTVGALRTAEYAGAIYIPAYKEGYHSDGATLWSEYVNITKDSEGLVDLVPVTPKWDGIEAVNEGTLGWQEIEEAVTAYTWTPEAECDPALTGDEKDEATLVAALPGITDAYDEGDVVYTEIDYVKTYYKLTAITYNVDGVDEYVGTKDDDNKPTSTEYNENDIVKVTTGTTVKYYKYHKIGAQAASGGHAVATPIGEALLLPPADENGYYIEFTYTRSKKVTEHTYKNSEDKVGITVTAGEGFKAGKSYRVTVVLYPDGEIKFGEADDSVVPDEWEEDDEESEGYTGGTDQKEWDLEQQ